MTTPEDQPAAGRRRVRPYAMTGGRTRPAQPDELPEQYGLHEGKYHLSPEQAQAILDLRLHRLTGLEHEKLLAEYKEILDQIGDTGFRQRGVASP